MSAAQALLDHYRETMTLPEALDRVQRNIEVGRRGWADPELLAALEKVHAEAAKPLCLLPDDDTAVERLAAALRKVWPGLVTVEAWPDAAAIIAALPVLGAETPEKPSDGSGNDTHRSRIGPQLTEQPALDVERLLRLAVTPITKWRSADLTWFSELNGGVDFIDGYDGELDNRKFAAYLARLTSPTAGGDGVVSNLTRFCGVGFHDRCRGTISTIGIEARPMTKVTPITAAGLALRLEYPGVWYWLDEQYPKRWEGPLGEAIEAEAAAPFRDALERLVGSASVSAGPFLTPLPGRAHTPGDAKAVKDAPRSKSAGEKDPGPVHRRG